MLDEDSAYEHFLLLDLLCSWSLSFGFFLFVFLVFESRGVVKGRTWNWAARIDLTVYCGGLI
jgi:hypothetical protein